MINVRLSIPPVLASNVVGLAGFLGFVIAVGALTDWRWGLMVGSLIAVGLAVLAQLGQRQAAEHAATNAAEDADTTRIEQAKTGGAKGKRLIDMAIAEAIADPGPVVMADRALKRVS